MPDVAARPALAGASVVFLVGTRADGLSDDALDQALAWAQKIQSAVGAGVIVDRLGPPLLAAAAVRAAARRVLVEGALTRAQLDGKLGGLRDHSLVLITRGLDSEGAPGPERQGLLLHNAAAVAPEGDAVITRAQLDRMQVQNDRVIPQAGKDELADAAAFVDAIRQAPFVHVYLACCAGTRAVGAVAERLAALTETTVFFNRAPIVFPDKPQAAAAKVAAKGFAFFAPRRGGPSVDLRSAPDGFLPGATDRAP